VPRKIQTYGQVFMLQSISGNGQRKFSGGATETVQTVHYGYEKKEEEVQ
jgi:hypothetical protein